MTSSNVDTSSGSVTTSPLVFIYLFVLFVCGSGGDVALRSVIRGYKEAVLCCVFQ